MQTARLALQVGDARIYVLIASSTSHELERVRRSVVINADNKNVTVQFDLSSWFKVGGQVINPTTANKSRINENAVKTNTRSSLHALEDDDSNGR